MSALSTLRLIAPEYASIADAVVEEWLGLAIASIAGADQWGGVYDQAVANLAAHLMARAGVGTTPAPGDGSANSGAITSVRTGDLAVGYGNVGGVGAGGAGLGDDDYTTTKYGMRYLALRASRARRMPRWAR